MTSQNWVVLDKLLGQAGVAQFLDCYEVRPAIFRIPADRLTPALFSRDDFETYLVAVRPDRDKLVVADGGLVVHEFTANPQPEDVAKAFRSGRTIVLNGIHERWPSVQQLSKELSCDLNLHTQVNAYLTPASSQGFPRHFDDHDVLVIQVEGSKVWRVWSGPVDLPLAGQHQSQRHTEAPAHADMVVTLGPGDVLYLPRGTYHEAEAQSETSLHLSVGLFPFLWVDALVAAIRSVAQEDRALRTSFWPIGAADHWCNETLSAKAFELLSKNHRKISQQVNTELFADSRPQLSATVIDGKLFPDTNREFDLDVLLTRCDTNVVVTKDDASITLCGPCGECRLPADMERAVIAALEIPRFRPRDLPDDYTDNAKLLLSKVLLNHGMLQIANESH